MDFKSRQDAGRRLGFRLRELGVQADVVAGLPRGGVVVAAVVADLLQCPLDVIVVRKVGHPWHREFAVGAIAEDDVLILDEELIAAIPLPRSELNAVIGEEEERLRQYTLKFHPHGPVELANSRVLIVDDGLATGSTAEAAILSARKRQAREIILAAPVGSTSACERLALLADQVITCLADPQFYAVGQYYHEFSPVTDKEVLALLDRRHADYRGAA
ncbi:MAG TPA: phosphoribosyltransferase family protein [Candidatus Acidoferrales bacterium]|nr:phosphoribosyltransferase family protein [Candidatus Acidoferrales bacterium]